MKCYDEGDKSTAKNWINFDVLGNMMMATLKTNEPILILHTRQMGWVGNSVMCYENCVSQYCTVFKRKE